MSTGEAEAAALTDVSGDAVAPATKKKTKGGNPKESKAKSPKKPAKVAASNGSTKTAEETKAAPKATPKAAPAKAKGTPDRSSYRAAADLLRMAADGTRVAVLLILSDNKQNVGELCSQLNQSQPATSHHLALLRHGGLITSTRNGKNNIYSLTPKGEALAESIKSVLEAAI